MKTIKFNKRIILLFVLITPMICYSQREDVTDAFHGYNGELIFVFRDSLDTELSNNKKIMLDTLANQMKSWHYKGFFVTKFYCYNNGIRKRSKLRVKNIIRYLKNVHHIKHNYFKVEYLNMKNEDFLHSQFEHIRIFKEYDKSLTNPYK